MSLITGALRSRNLLLGAPEESPCGSSVVLRNQTMAVANTNSAGRSQLTSRGPLFDIWRFRGSNDVDKWFHYRLRCLSLALPLLNLPGNYRWPAHPKPGYLIHLNNVFMSRILSYYQYKNHKPNMLRKE